MAGTLYVVATPIGNLADITLRAIEILRSAARVVAEDTRRTRALLSHLGIEKKPLTSIDAHASARELERVIGWLLDGEDVALATDAGVPSISDPGAALVGRAAAAGIRVAPVPGASALTAAIAASGLVSGGFRFFGFLPRGGTARADALAALLATPEAVVFFEAPQRIGRTLAELAELCPDRQTVIARELTKLHEELVRGSVRELASAEREWRGEVTVVLAPDAAARPHGTVAEAEIDARIHAELAGGGAVKDVAQRVAAWSGRSRREIYERALGCRARREPTG